MSAPTAAQGWREYWQALDGSDCYSDAGVTPCNNNDTCAQWNGTLGVVAGSEFAEAADKPTFKTGGAGGSSYLDFDGSSNEMTSNAASDFLAVGAKTLIIACSVDAILVNNDGVFQDSGGYIYISVTTTGDKIQFFNWDGPGYDNTAGHAIVAGTPFVYTCWHTGGNIYDQLNLGSASSAVASGNTSDLSNTFNLGQRGGNYLGMNLYAFAAANVEIAEADRNAVVRYFMGQLGI